MTTNRSTCICARHPCLLTEGGNQTQVQVLSAKPMRTVAEQEVCHFSRLSINHLRLFGTYLFPSQDSLADERINRLGEGMPCFVNRNIEQTDRFHICLCFSF